MNIYNHDCGCITVRDKDKITFKKMCKRHKRNNKYIWIALQHPKEELK